MSGHRRWYLQLVEPDEQALERRRRQHSRRKARLRKRESDRERQREREGVVTLGGMD
jgi:hypothetical protein